MLLGFLPQLLLWKKLLVRLIKKCWQNMALYLSVEMCKTNTLSEYKYIFYGININDSSWSAFTIVKIQQDSNTNSFLF